MGASLAWDSGPDSITYLLCELGSFTPFSGLVYLTHELRESVSAWIFLFPEVGGQFDLGACIHPLGDHYSGLHYGWSLV